MVGPLGWLVGIVAAVGALATLGFEFALFASAGGVIFAAVAAFWFGAGVAAVIDPRHSARNALIVAISIAAAVVLYVGMVSSRPAPPGTSYGGPNVMPPQPESAPKWS